MKGIKFDSSKPRMDLLPPKALKEVAQVLTFGAEKYKANNWRYVNNWEERYLAATLRHVVAILEGEKQDPETGLSHEAHAICCLMFLIDNRFWQEKVKSDNTQTDNN